MGRRKKEAPEIHRENIACAAQRLFLAKGVEAATMDEIAREAGYSKATLYVYYKNKEEIFSVLAFKSMKHLYDYIYRALEGKEGTKAKYRLLCRALLRYQEEYPLYFKMALEEINVDSADGEAFPENRESRRIGEEINGLLRTLLEEGIWSGELRRDLSVMPTIFSFWAMLSGLILLAEHKENYIRQEMKLSKQEFLEYGFDTLYRSIAAAGLRGA